VRLAYLRDASRETALYALRRGLVTSPGVRVALHTLPLAVIIAATPTRQYDAMEASALAVPRARGDAPLILSPGLLPRGGGFLFVLQDSPLSSPADLRGRTVVVTSLGSTTVLEIRYVLRERYGLSAASQGAEVTLMEAAPEVAPVLLEAGVAEAALLVHAHAYHLLHDERFRLLADITAQFQELVGGETMSTVIITHRDTVARKGPALGELVPLLEGSLAYFREHQEEVITQVAMEEGVSLRYLEWWWQTYEFPQGRPQERHLRALENLWRAAQRLGEFESYPPVEETLLRLT